MLFAPRRFSFALWLFVVLPANAYSQSSIDLEYRFGLLTAADHTPNVVDPGPSNVTGTSRDNRFSLDYSRTLVSLFGDNIAIDGSFGVSQSFGSFFASALSLAYSGTFIHAAAMARHSFSNIEVGIGGWVDAPLSQTLTRTPASNRSILYPAWPFGTRVDIGYGKWAVAGIAIHPMLFGAFDFSANRQPGLNAASALSGGVSFQFMLGSTEAANVSRTEVPEMAQISKPVEQSSETSAIHAEIHFTTSGHRLVSGESIPIEAHDTLIRQYTMLPSHIEMVGNHLAPGYALLSPAEAQKFTMDSLARMDENGIARNLLNIIGTRLRSSPEMSVTLRYGDGNASHDLVNYWKERFHVSDSQIVQTKEGIASSKIGIGPTQPVVTQWIERTYSLGEFGLERNIDASRGVRSWFVDLMQSGEIISHLSSVSSDTAIILRSLQAHSASSIVAKFVAEDSAENRTASFDTLHLAVQPQPEKISLHQHDFVLYSWPIPHRRSRSKHS